MDSAPRLEGANTVLLLISGASGVGKTTVRLAIEGDVAADVESVELRHLGTVPAVPTVRWRQQMVERAASRATELAADGRHLLLAGDPVAAGEVLAAPSAAMLDVAVCLLDADDHALGQRLDRRRDPVEIRHHHLAYAGWLRAHANDPTHISGGADRRQLGGHGVEPLDRSVRRGSTVEMAVIDTSDLLVEKVSGASPEPVHGTSPFPADRSWRARSPPRLA